MDAAILYCRQPSEAIMNNEKYYLVLCPGRGTVLQVSKSMICMAYYSLITGMTEVIIYSSKT
jgi:hypothetical protein